MEDPATKISNRGSRFRFFYLLVFDRIHECHAFEQDDQNLREKNRPTTLKIQQYIYGMGYFLTLFVLIPSGGLLAVLGVTRYKSNALQ